MNAIGRINVSTICTPTGYAPIGYFPASSSDRSTSVAFHTFVNQIVVVPTANQSEYKITSAKKIGSTPSGYDHHGNPIRVPAYPISTSENTMFGNPHGVMFRVDN